MRKTLLSVLAVGSISCASATTAGPSQPFHSVMDPYMPKENEELFTYNPYEDEVKQCVRAHYLETEGNQLKSFLVTDHCAVRNDSATGTYYTIRFKDNNGNGDVDEVCGIMGKTYIGKLDVRKEQCKTTLPGKPLQHIMSALVTAGSIENPPPFPDMFYDVLPKLYPQE